MIVSRGVIRQTISLLLKVSIELLIHSSLCLTAWGAEVCKLSAASWQEGEQWGSRLIDSCFDRFHWTDGTAAKPWSGRPSSNSCEQTETEFVMDPFSRFRARAQPMMEKKNIHSRFYRENGLVQILFESTGFLITVDKIWENMSQNAPGYCIGKKVIFHSVVMVYNCL